MTTTNSAAAAPTAGRVRKPRASKPTAAPTVPVMSADDILSLVGSLMPTDAPTADAGAPRITLASKREAMTSEIIRRVAAVGGPVPDRDATRDAVTASIVNNVRQAMVALADEIRSQADRLTADDVTLARSGGKGQDVRARAPYVQVRADGRFAGANVGVSIDGITADVLRPTLPMPVKKAAAPAAQ
jgi:hypothetical protein